MALSNTPGRSEKGEPYRAAQSTVSELEGHLRDVKGGHFPIYDGDRIIGVFVGVDQFNVLLHVASLLDDQRITATLSHEPSTEENRYLSVDEVFGG